VFFIKRYENELGSKKIATVPRQRREKCLLVFLNANRNDPQAHGITVVAFHPEVFRVSYFPQGTEANILPSSSKDNTRIELARVVVDSYDFRV